jgi:hypothetical protein
MRKGSLLWGSWSGTGALVLPKLPYPMGITVVVIWTRMPKRALEAHNILNPQLDLLCNRLAVV